jgi:hypothetical protein
MLQEFCYIQSLANHLFGLKRALIGCHRMRKPLLQTLGMNLLSSYFPICQEAHSKRCVANYATAIRLLVHCPLQISPMTAKFTNRNPLPDHQEQ